MIVESVNVAAAADTALAASAWVRGVRTRSAVSTVLVAPRTPSPPGIDWTCVARVETGSNFQMHGSAYSSAYGVMNEAVRENAPADVAARILSGTASEAEQLAMAESVAARHGFGAWAAGTVAACSR